MVVVFVIDSSWLWHGYVQCRGKAGGGWCWGQRAAGLRGGG